VMAARSLAESGSCAKSSRQGIVITEIGAKWVHSFSIAMSVGGG
jgi:hypothetical protein